MYPLGNQAGSALDMGAANARMANVQTIAKDPQRITIPLALDEQQGSVQQLHEVITQLEARLSDVLAHEPTGESANAPVPQPSQILDRLGMHTRGVHSASTRLMHLIKRLHL